MTNLLPLERQQALARDYTMRLSVVIVWLVTALALCAAVLLMPTYVLLTKSAEIKEVRLANIEASLSSAEEAALAARLSSLSSNAAALTALGKQSSASGTVREALTIAHPKIALLGFTYAPAMTKEPGTLAISGHAETRGALRDYQLALQSAPFASSVVLPVSAYAKDTDITFTITVTLMP